jgi:predicted dehydrogenase
MVVRVGLVGAGKMGISHYAIVNAQPEASVVAVCDTSGYVLSVLKKYTGVETYDDFAAMIDRAALDAVFVATPTATHFPCAERALKKDLHLFVEKPLTLAPEQSLALSKLAKERRRVNQVGFHNRFIGTFREARRILKAGGLGTVASVHGSAFGQVVVREQATTWRSKKSEGGGCLHDYTCHVVDLMNFLVGPPSRVVGARMQSIFSKDVEDAVHAIFAYPDGSTGLLETNWSDETVRKMSTTIVVHGTEGKLVVDRQELKVHFRSGNAALSVGGPVGGSTGGGYEEGWNTRYITDLQEPVGFYLRGEEYSAQVEAFVAAVSRGDLDHENSFASAYETDKVLDSIARASRASGT